MDFTAIDTTSPNLHRAVVNSNEKKYTRIISIEAWAFPDFCNSQFFHYSVLINLAIYFNISHSALILPKKNNYKHKYDFRILCTKISLTRHFSENLRKSLLSFDWERLKSSEDGEKVDAKNEHEEEKIWENALNFWFLHIKIRLYGNFHENLSEKNFN